MKEALPSTSAVSHVLFSKHFSSILLSDSKKEMEVKANEMAKGEESQRSESDSSGHDMSHLSDGELA